MFVEIVMTPLVDICSKSIPVCAIRNSSWALKSCDLRLNYWLVTNQSIIKCFINSKRCENDTHAHAMNDWISYCKFDGVTTYTWPAHVSWIFSICIAKSISLKSTWSDECHERVVSMVVKKYIGEMQFVWWCLRRRKKENHSISWYDSMISFLCVLD